MLRFKKLGGDDAPPPPVKQLQRVAALLALLTASVCPTTRLLLAPAHPAFSGMAVNVEPVQVSADPNLTFGLPPMHLVLLPRCLLGYLFGVGSDPTPYGYHLGLGNRLRFWFGGGVSPPLGRLFRLNFVRRHRLRR